MWRRGRWNLNLVALFMAWVGFSVFLHLSLLDFLAAPSRVYPYLIFPMMGFGMYNLIKTAEDASETRLFLRGLFLLSVSEAFLVILQSNFSFPKFDIIESPTYVSERGYLGFLFPSIFDRRVESGTGTYEHFNGVGALLALVLPVSFSFWFGQRKSAARLGLFCILFLGTFFTYSRGALLGASFGIVFVYLFGFTRDPRRTMKKVLVPLTLVFVLLVDDLFRTYFAETQNLTSRELVWDAAWDYATSNPLGLITGFGYEFFSGFLQSTYTGAGLISLHSAILQVFLELGVVGFVIASLYFVRLSKAILAKGDQISLALLGGIIAFGFHQAFDNSLFRYNGVMMFSLCAIAETSLKKYPSELLAWWGGATIAQPDNPTGNAKVTQ